jgi:hypothetical protein
LNRPINALHKRINIDAHLTQINEVLGLRLTGSIGKKRFESI